MWNGCPYTHILPCCHGLIIISLQQASTRNHLRRKFHLSLSTVEVWFNFLSYKLNNCKKANDSGFSEEHLSISKLPRIVFRKYTKGEKNKNLSLVTEWWQKKLSSVSHLNSPVWFSLQSMHRRFEFFLSWGSLSVSLSFCFHPFSLRIKF